jgi:uncharacterized membrane protein
MAFCGKCGTEVKPGTLYCSSCGAPVGTTPGGTGASPAAAGTGVSSNVAGMLTYIPFVGWIIAIIFLLIEPYRSERFVRFHAFQSVFFAIFCFVLNWVVSIAGLSALWGFGFSPLWMIGGIIRLGLLVLWIYLMAKAYNREQFMLPVIGPLAAQQAGSAHS